MGDEVGTLTIPPLNPGESTVLKFEWNVPNPEDYVNINSNPWHFCLLGRIVTPEDPMTTTETADLAANILNNNNIVGITPDGPRGPKQKIKEGLVSMQKKTGAIIIPLSYSAKYNVTLKSWDSFLFSFPFNKFVAVWGNPIFYDDKKKLKDNIQNVQNELDRVTSLSENLSK